MDANSDYCYLLLCTHFRATCAVAVDEQGQVRGAVTAYRRPDQPEVLFYWQLVVDAEARGQGLAGRLVDAVLDRPACAGITSIETTVSPSNAPSNAVFDRLAERRGWPVVRSALFDASCFAGDHEDEVLIRIGPIHSKV